MSALEVATVTVGWLVLTFSGAIHAASTGLLNDTGQLRCDDGSTVLAPCTDANAGDGSTGWRVPAHRELPSIVNNGLSAAPTIDAACVTSSVHLGGGASR